MVSSVASEAAYLDLDVNISFRTAPAFRRYCYKHPQNHETIKEMCDIYIYIYVYEETEVNQGCANTKSRCGRRV